MVIPQTIDMYFLFSFEVHYSYSFEDNLILQLSLWKFWWNLTAFYVLAFISIDMRC